jgi:hypothetical protein
MKSLFPSLIALGLLLAPLSLCGEVDRISPKVDAAAAAALVEGMFPRGVSHYLRLFDESALGDRFAGVRITRLGPGTFACFRIWWPATELYRMPQKPVLRDPQITVKQGGFSQPDIKGVTLDASRAEIERLLEMFRSEELFNLPPRDETGVRGGTLDGSVWIFERWDYDRYRVVARTNPQGGPVKRCSDAVSDLLRHKQPSKGN